MHPNIIKIVFISEDIPCGIEYSVVYSVCAVEFFTSEIKWCK